MQNRITQGCIIPHFTQIGHDMWTVGVEIHYGHKQNFIVTKPIFMKHMLAEHLIWNFYSKFEENMINDLVADNRLQTGELAGVVSI